MTFGDYFKSLRANQKLTQQEVAEKLDVTVTTIQNWEGGKNIPDIQNLKAISKVFNTPSDYLFSLLVETDNRDEGSGEIELKMDKCSWIKLLPTDFNFKLIEDLHLSSDEFNLFTDIVLYKVLGGDLTQLALNDFMGNKIRLLEVAKRLLEAELIKYQYQKGYTTSHDRCGDISSLHPSNVVTTIPEVSPCKNEIYLTSLGRLCFSKLKGDKLFFKKIYSLPFQSFIDLYNQVYSSRSGNEFFPLEELNELCDGGIMLEEFEEKIYCYNWFNSDEEIRKRTVRNAFPQSLSEFFEVVEVELEDERYKEERLSYLKQLEFYEENKELPGLRKPSFVAKQALKKMIPTQKAIDFMEEYKKGNN